MTYEDMCVFLHTHIEMKKVTILLFDFNQYRLMHGSSYIWGFLVPASILLFVGFYLSAQLSSAVKLTAALQIDQRARNKIIKRRGLQVGLFFKVRNLLIFIEFVLFSCEWIYDWLFRRPKLMNVILLFCFFFDKRLLSMSETLIDIL